MINEVVTKWYSTRRLFCRLQKSSLPNISLVESLSSIKLRLDRVLKSSSEQVLASLHTLLDKMVDDLPPLTESVDVKRIVGWLKQTEKQVAKLEQLVIHKGVVHE